MNIGKYFLVVFILIYLMIVIFLIKNNKNKDIKLSDVQNFLIERYKESKNHNLEDKIGMPIYYINLDKSEHRKCYIEKQCRLYNIHNITRVPGVYGKKLNFSRDIVDFNGEQIRYINNFTDCSKSELGCLLSHFKAIYTAYTNGDQIALICEDDVSFSLLPYWKYNLRDIINDAPNDWDIISLFHIVCQSNKEPYIRYSEQNNCYSNLSYIINRRGMEKCLESILVNGMFYFDNNLPKWTNKLVADMYIYYKCNTYWFNKDTLFFPYNNDEEMNSTIHTDHTENHINNTLRLLSKYIDIRDGNIVMKT